MQQQRSIASTQKQLQDDSKIFDFTKRKKWPDLLVNELTGVVLLVLSNVGKLLYCGEAAKELLGWKEDVVELKITDLIHRECRLPLHRVGRQRADSITTAAVL